jgi:hypothetical protein
VCGGRSEQPTGGERRIELRASLDAGRFKGLDRHRSRHQDVVETVVFACRRLLARSEDEDEGQETSEEGSEAVRVSIDAVVIAGGEKDGFRIVRQTSGEKVTYLVEMPDGWDALGVERWKDVSAEGKVVKTMRDFIIRQSLKSQE